MVDQSPEPATAGPFTPAEAAKILGCGEEWMRRNAARLPHRRYGRRIVFELADLDEIRAMHRQAPAVQPTASVEGVALPEPRGARLRPKGAQRAQR